MHTLVLVSHPQLERSKAHTRLVEAIHGLPGVEIRHLESAYPDDRGLAIAEFAATYRALLAG